MDDEFLDPNDYYADQDENWSRDSTSSSEAPQETLHRSVGWVAAALLLFAIVWVYSYPEWFSSSSTGSADSLSPINIEIGDGSGGGIVADKIEEITGLSVPIPEQFDWAKDEKTAANRSRVDELKRQLADISSLANENTDGLVAVKAKIAGLLNSVEGMRIASQKERVDEFIGLQKKTSELTATLPASDTFVADVTALLKRISDAGDASYSPAELLFTQAGAYQRQQNEKSDEIKRYLDAADRLIRVTAGLTPGQALSAAIKMQNEEDDKKIAEELGRVREDSQKDRVTRVSGAEKARLKAETDVIVGEIDDITEDLIDKRKHAAAMAAQLKLEREFAAAEPEIRMYLAYLLADGRSHRGTAEGIGPVSYQAVEQSGVTVAGKDGTIRMSRWIGSNGYGWNAYNNRAKQSRTYILNDFLYTQPKYESSIRFAEKAKILFQKFGLLMRDKGMLAK